VYEEILKMYLKHLSQTTHNPNTIVRV